MRLKRTAVTAATLAAAAGAAVAAAASDGMGAQAASTGAQAASTHTVTLKNIRFHPGSLTIKRGDTVKWVWRDGPTEHNVTGSHFKSKTMAKGSFSVRFTKRGTFDYRCTIHGKEGMTGKIVVH
jgi:plastocyanin